MRVNMHRKNEGVTMVELAIALSLMCMLVVIFINIVLWCRNFMYTSITDLNQRSNAQAIEMDIQECIRMSSYANCHDVQNNKLFSGNTKSIPLIFIVPYRKDESPYYIIKRKSGTKNNIYKMYTDIIDTRDGDKDTIIRYSDIPQVNSESFELENEDMVSRINQYIRSLGCYGIGGEQDKISEPDIGDYDYLYKANDGERYFIDKDKERENMVMKSNEGKISIPYRLRGVNLMYTDIDELEIIQKDIRTFEININICDGQKIKTYKSYVQRGSI